MAISGYVTVRSLTERRVRILTNIYRVSATNLSVIYEKTLSRKAATGSVGNETPGTIFLDCFFIYALLKERESEGEALELPHQVEHAYRLTRAMNDRNVKTGSNGLHHWYHACDGCVKTVTENETGRRCT